MRAEDLPHLDADALGPMLDPVRTAVVVVDVQVDFAAPHGALGRRGVNLGDAEPAIDRIEALIAAARRAAAQVVFVKVVTRPETDSRALRTLYARKGRPPAAMAICRADSEGAAFYRLQPHVGDLVVAKVKFDAFHGTDLAQRLRRAGVESLLVTGLTTDCCVDQTARSAFHHDFDVFVVSDACAAYGADLHLGALNALEKNCALLVTSEAVIAALGGREPARQGTSDDE